VLVTGPAGGIFPGRIEWSAGMDMQTLIVALVVLAAAVFVGNKVRRTVLAARAPTGKGKDCGGDCGCSR
jgi:hypothetical protein